MNTAWSVFKKDIRSCGIVVILWLAWICLQTGLGAWAPSTTGHPVVWTTYQIVSLLGPMLQYLLLVILIPLVVHEDPLVDAKAFWLTRPISRQALLMGKLLFIGLVMVVPVLLGELTVLACNGIAFRHILLALLEILLRTTSQMCVIVVLAALTANFAHFAVVGVSYLVAAGVVGFILTIFSGFLKGFLMRHSSYPADSWGMESIGLLQSRDVAAWAATLLIGSLVLAWHYLTRKTTVAVMMALSGALCVVIMSHVWPIDFLGGDGKGQKVKARGEAIDPESIHLTITDPRLNDVSFGSYHSTTLDMVLSLQDVFQGCSVEITEADVTFTRTDGHTFHGQLMPQFAFQVERRETASASTALWSAVRKDLGEIHMLHVSANPETTNMNLSVQFMITDAENGKQSVGEKVAVSGEVEFGLFECQKVGMALLKAGDGVGSELCRDRILDVHRDARTTEVRLRKQTVSLVFGGEKKSGSILPDMMKMPWNDLEYLLVNRKRGNEVVACESIAPDDMLFLMTLSLRMFDRAHPPQLDFVDLKLVFPAVSEEWLKDAELVCFKKLPAGSFKKKIEFKDFLIPKAERKPSVVGG